LVEIAAEARCGDVETLSQCNDLECCEFARNSMTALHRNEPAKGIELMASASPYERAYPDAVYVRGLIYLDMKRGAEAVAEFRKITDHEGASWGATWVHPYWGQYYALS
jgi:hypothetical protein